MFNNLPRSQSLQVAKTQDLNPVSASLYLIITLQALVSICDSSKTLHPPSYPDGGGTQDTDPVALAEIFNRLQQKPVKIKVNA